jgi:hypothetical protein
MQFCLDFVSGIAIHTHSASPVPTHLYLPNCCFILRIRNTDIERDIYDESTFNFEALTFDVNIPIPTQ